MSNLTISNHPIFHRALPGNAMELFEIGLVDDMEDLQATLLVTVTPTLASSGQTVGTICIGQDIAKLKDGPGGGRGPKPW